MTTFCVYKAIELIAGPLASEDAYLECVALGADWVVERELAGAPVQQTSRAECLAKLRKILTGLSSPR